jgi:predicted  nucleic acid-binding Zn-ribbon protein
MRCARNKAVIGARADAGGASFVKCVDRDGIVDQELKQLMKELGEAINQAVAESDEISDVMARIKAGGNEVFLVLEATIGFNQRETAPANEFKSNGELEITSQDMKFLRSMRIAVNDKR